MTIPSRRRLRFSLRTLLLATLTLASAATLWWNWGPWTPAFAVDAPNNISEVFFSADDKFAMFNYRGERDPKSGQRSSFLEVRRTDTGKRHALLVDERGGDSAEVKGSYAMLLQKNWWGQAPTAPPVFIFDWLKAATLASDPIFKQDGAVTHHWSECRLGKTCVALPLDAKTLVYKLPNFELAAELPGKREISFLDDGRLLSWEIDKPVSIHDPATSRVVIAQGAGIPDLELKPRNGWTVLLNKSYSALLNTANGRVSRTEGQIRDFSPDGKFALVERDGSEITDVIDLSDGKSIKTFDANNMLFSPDGSLILDQIMCSVYGRDFNLLWSANANWSDFSPDGQFVVTGTRIYAARSGRLLMDLSAFPHRVAFCAVSKLTFAHQNPIFVTNSGLAAESPQQQNRATLWRLSRPWQWYGPAYLPEFWLTILLAAAFLWSIFRDRRLGKGA